HRRPAALQLLQDHCGLIKLGTATQLSASVRQLPSMRIENRAYTDAHIEGKETGTYSNEGAAIGCSVGAAIGGAFGAAFGGGLGGFAGASFGCTAGGHIGRALGERVSYALQ
ncbi:hypothetical protein, partial [Rhizobium sp. NLR22b]|uniref:hypothetical protein n=1 Tax=Rhizobium sp. NLR22b TaxID=2731115 RepID=UPI003870A338